MIPLVYWGDPDDSMFSEVPKKDARILREDQIILFLAMFSLLEHVNIGSEVQSNTSHLIPRVEDTQNSI